MTDAIRTPDELFEGLPDFDFEPSFRQADELRLAHIDTGEGAPALFMHGEPTGSFLWRKGIPPVPAAGFRCVAPDLPGLGRSPPPAVRRCARPATRGSRTWNPGPARARFR